MAYIASSITRWRFPHGRRRLVVLAGAAVLAAAVAGGAYYGLARTSVEPVPPVNAENGLAIRGYDPVAYFTTGMPQPGQPEFSLSWRGATWRFASAENLQTFRGDPEHYAPRYGGYCAWAVSQGYTAPIDPTVWNVVDGRLYLNFDADVQARWQKDIPGNIASADRNWPELHRAE